MYLQPFVRNCHFFKVRLLNTFIVTEQLLKKAVHICVVWRLCDRSLFLCQVQQLADKLCEEGVYVGSGAKSAGFVKSMKHSTNSERE